MHCILFNHQWCVLEFYCWLQRCQPDFLYLHHQFGEDNLTHLTFATFFLFNFNSLGKQLQEAVAVSTAAILKSLGAGHICPMPFRLVEAGFACAEYASIQVAGSCMGCLQKRTPNPLDMITSGFGKQDLLDSRPQPKLPSTMHPTDGTLI